MPRYSRDQAISAIRSFYQFFATLPSLPPEYIWEPPSSGWSEINSASLSHLGKNRDVIDLLRHIPYINDTQIAFETTVIDYTRLSWGLDKGSSTGVVPPSAGVIPEYVVSLTDGGVYGSWLLLDTRAGTITEFSQTAPPEQEYPPRGHPEYWRAYLTLSIHEFFGYWKERYRSLEWVVVPDYERGIVCGNDEGVDEIRDIYKEHGWPFVFRREECKDALLRRKEERYKSLHGNGLVRGYYR